MASYLKKAKTYHRMFGLRGLLYAACKGPLLANRLVTVRTPRLAHPVSLRLGTSDIPTFEKIVHAEEYKVPLARSPRVIIDGGANIGLAAVYFANAFPDARILSVEPERSNFELLKKNVARYPQVTPVRAALWNENTTVRLDDPGAGKWAFRTSKTGGTAGDGVPAFTLGRLMEEHGIGRIDLLKLDIEGAEKEVFDSSAEWIDRVDVIAAELHDKIKPGSNRSFYLATKDFKIEWRDGENIFLVRDPGLLSSLNAGQPALANVA